MFARACGMAALVFGLFSSGCDAGTTTLQPAKGDPTDEGIDQDLGAGDDVLEQTPVERHGHLKVVGTQLQNESGEAVQLKGVSSMWLNWENDGFAEDPTALRWMRNNWNLTVIRAAMGVEEDSAYTTDPERARAQVYRMVDNAIDAGVYVIVDFHSHNAHQYQDLAIEFFSELAATYAGEPNLIYETFNEPLEISWSELKTYHEAVIAAIREHDEEAPIVLGTPSWSQKVDEAAADPVDGHNLMYTLHYYSCTHTSWLRSRAGAALAQGIALFVTEYGATHADGGTDGLLCLEEAQLWNDWMRERKISWTAWKLDNCEQDSSCLLAPDAPLDGGWTNEYLNGHARFVRGRMQRD